MKKFALLSAALFVLTLAGYAGTVVRSKSNISNNRDAACHGTVSGKAGHQKLACSGTCPTGKCEVHSAADADGGKHEWCSCANDEPKDCHIVLRTAKDGTTSIQCPKDCKCQ